MDFGHTWDDFRTCLGHVWCFCWTCFGYVLDMFGACFGHVWDMFLDMFWTSFGLVLDKFLANKGTSFSNIWAIFQTGFFAFFPGGRTRDSMESKVQVKIHAPQVTNGYTNAWGNLSLRETGSMPAVKGLLGAGKNSMSAEPSSGSP